VNSHVPYRTLHAGLRPRYSQQSYSSTSIRLSLSGILVAEGRFRPKASKKSKCAQHKFGEPNFISGSGSAVCVSTWSISAGDSRSIKETEVEVDFKVSRAQHKGSQRNRLVLYTFTTNVPADLIQSSLHHLKYGISKQTITFHRTRTRCRS
jgi:hypothetical protein